MNSVHPTGFTARHDLVLHHGNTSGCHGHLARVLAAALARRQVPIGFDRLAELVGLNQGELTKKPDIFLAALGSKSQLLAFEWICALGIEGVRAEMDFSDKSLKSQMKRAGRLEAPYALILGENELEEGVAILRNMEDKKQISVPLDNAVETIKNMIYQ